MFTNFRFSLSSKKAKKNSDRLKGWWVPIGLLLLSAVPAIGGTVRLGQLASGINRTAETARFFESPLPVVLHIISVTLFSVLGALQFAPSLRKRSSGWHRRFGRLAAPAGIVAALTGLWMSQFYDLPAHDGILLYWQRLFVGIGMVLAILLSMLAIWRKDFLQHAAWITRAYALGMGAGTQVLTIIPWLLFPGLQGPLFRGILMGAAWAFNLAVAEWWIWTRLLRKGRRRKRTAVSLKS